MAATHQAYTLLFSTHQPPIACAAAAGIGTITPRLGSASGVNSGFVIVLLGPPISQIGPPTRHRGERVSYCRHSRQDTPSPALHLYPASLLGSTDFSSVFLASGVKVCGQGKAVGQGLTCTAQQQVSERQLLQAFPTGWLLVRPYIFILSSR